VPLLSIFNPDAKTQRYPVESFFQWTPGLPGSLSLGGGIGSTRGFLFAIVTTLAAIGLNFLAPDGLRDPVYMDFLVAIVATQFVAGFRPALLAGVMSVYFLFEQVVPSVHAAGVFARPESFRLLNFVVIAGVLLMLNTRSFLLKWQARRWRQKFMAMRDGRSEMSLFEWDIEQGAMVWSDCLSALRNLKSGESFRDRIPEPDRSHAESVLGEAARSGSAFELRFRVHGAGGEERWMVATGLFLKAGRRPRWAIGTISDETALLRAHDRLRSSEHHFELAQKMTLMATWEWEVNAPVLQWSPGSGPVFGRTDDGFNMSVKEFYTSVHPQDQQRLKELFNRSCADHGDYEAEFRYYWPDGSLHWLFTRARTIMDHSGAVCRLIGVTLEITARKRAEDALRASERLAANGRLAATLAHEINTPLNSLRSVMYLLEHHAGSSPAVRRYLDMGQREIIHAAEIIRQTLGLYREPDGVVSASPKEEIEQVLIMYQARARRDRIEIESRIDFDGVIPVLPGEIRQILTNLLLNAIDAGASRLRIHLYLSHVVDGAPQRVVRLVVSDDGAGIPSAIMPRLFEPFYTTKGEKGTGLGLWVICNILHKYGGSIDIRSSENPARHGTTFMVRLPIELPPLLTGSGEEQQALHPHKSAEACGIGPGSAPADSSSRSGAA